MRPNQILLVIFTILLVGCGLTPSRSDYYTVKAGDTVYSISVRTGIDYRELARLNNLDSTYRIHAGQVLRLSSQGTVANSKIASSKVATSKSSSSLTKTKQAASSSVSSPTIQWQWPCKPTSVTETRMPNGSVGLSLRGEVGQDVVASANGKVVYAGGGLLGYGQLIIVKHDDVYLSAYAHLQTMKIKEGSQVNAGQRIATMGRNTAGTPLLYFEIRTNGVTVKPMTLLPAP